MLVVSCVGWGTSSLNNNWSWRSITVLQAFPSLLQLIGIWWIPESPRFLVNKDKSEQALEILTKHHGGGDVNNPTVQFQYREIKETIQADRDAKTGSSYLDFFRTKGNRWRLAIIISLGIISQYSGNALFSNYIDIIYEGAGIKDQNKKLAVSDFSKHSSSSDNLLKADIAHHRKNNHGSFHFSRRGVHGRQGWPPTSIFDRNYRHGHFLRYVDHCRRHL